MRKSCIPWVSLCGLLSLGLCNGASAQQVHISHCLNACPAVSDPNNEIVLHHLYAASVVPASGTVEWVAYRVLEDSVGVASLLPRYWQDDELLVSELSLQTSEPSVNFIQPDLSEAQDREYRTSEVFQTSEDQGRLAPMTSFAGTPYWAELNLLSNMSSLPQSLRIGAWSGLDQAVNELTAQLSPIYVVAGPLAAPAADQEPPGFFKVISDGKSVAAFTFAASLPPHAHYCDQLSSLPGIERQVSLNLFPDASSLDDIRLVSALGCGNR